MKRNIRLLSLISFFMDLDFLAPVAIVYFSQVAGSFTLGMSIFAWVMVASAVFEVPTGIFSDRIGRKNTVICGALASVTYAFVLFIGNSYGALVLAAIFAGLARSFYSGNNEALLYDSLAAMDAKDTFSDHMGKIGMFFQIALAVSALTGSIVASQSFLWVLGISVIPKFGILLASFFLVEPPVHSKKSGNAFAHLGSSLAEFRGNTKLQLLTAVGSLRFAFGESAFVFRSAFVALLWPLWALGIVTMLSHTFGAAGFYFSGKLIKKFRPLRLLIFETVINRVIGISALIMQNTVSPVLMSATSFPYGTAEVAMKSLLHKEFTDHQRATMGSLGSFINYLVFACASLVLGLVADAWGPTIALVYAHCILLIPLFFYRKYSGTTNNTYQRLDGTIKTG